MKKGRNRERAGIRIFRRLLLLSFLLLIFSAGFQYYLQKRLLRYQTESAAGSRAEENAEEALMLPLPEDMSEQEEPLSRLKEELRVLEETERALLQSKSGLSLREKHGKVAALWEEELKRIAEITVQQLPEEKRESFYGEQRRFAVTRNREAMKELNEEKSGAQENADYLKRYSELTRARCYELWKRLSEMEAAVQK